MTRARTVVAALAATLAAGCSAPAVASRAQSTVVDVQRRVIRTDDYGISTSLDAPRDSALRALAAAYADLGIPADVVDTAQYALARNETLFPRSFQGKRASVFFACGDRPMGGSHADNGRVYASIRSQVLAGTGGSVVQTLVEGRVVPDGGTSGGPLHCGSTGEIERLLAERAASRLRAR